MESNISNKVNDAVLSTINSSYNCSFKDLADIESMEVLHNINGNSFSKQDIYKEYVDLYQKKSLESLSIEQRKGIEASFKNHDSIYTHLGKYIATYLHLTNNYRINETDELFKEILVCPKYPGKIFF